MVGTLHIDGVAHPIQGVTLTLDNPVRDNFDVTSELSEIAVTGSATCYFTLADLYPCHPVKRELMWAAHNLIAHPLSEVLHWIGYLFPPARDFGLWLHDITVPIHPPGTGRG